MSRVENPKPPRQLFSLGDDGTYKPQSIWFCGECNKLNPGQYSEQTAADCCRLKHCACGGELPEYWTVCQKCRDREFHEKETAQFLAMPIVEYDGGSPVYYNDQYYESLDEMIEGLMDEEDADSLPEYVEVCRKENIGSKICAEDIISNILERVTEDMEDPDCYDPNGTEELKTAIETFAAAQTYEYWWPDGKRVAVPKPREKEDAHT